MVRSSSCGDPGASADAIAVAVAVAIAFGVRVGLHPSWLVQKRSPRALRPFRTCN
jgi:hypothetical protein